MLNKLFLLTVLSLLLISEKIDAQKSWTLEECISHAMKANLQIRQAENNLDISDQTLLQNRASSLPSLNGTATHNYNSGRNIDPFTNLYTNQTVRSNNFGLNSSVVLFNGLQIRKSIQQSRYDYMAYSFQVETLKNDISLNISAAYLDILFNKELVTNSITQLTITKLQYERSLKLVEAGALSQTILYDLKSQRASEEAVLVRNNSALTLSYLNLTQYLDLPAEEAIEVVRPETLVISIDSSQSNNPTEIVKTAVETQPQIKNFEYRRLSSIQALMVAKGRQSPRLSLNANISTLYSSSSKEITGKSPAALQTIGYTQNSLEPVVTSFAQNIYENKNFSTQFKDNYTRFIGLSLSIPIFNGYQVKTAITRAKLNADNASLDLEISKLNLEKNIRKAYADSKASLENFNASYNSVRASEEALKNAEKRFEVGLINSFEYNQNKVRLATAQSDLLRAKYDYIFKIKILDFYKGIPLKL